MKDRAKASLIKSNMSIKRVMEIIENSKRIAPETPGGIALAVDKKNKLIGLVTDGDIRRALLAGADVNSEINDIINRQPIVFDNDLTYSEMLNQTIEGINRGHTKTKRLEVLVTVDKKGRPYDIFSFFELWCNSEVRTRIVSIVGLGYVGLTLGFVLADCGFKIIGVDENKQIVENLRKKKIHIHEEGIENYLDRYLNKRFYVKHNFDSNESDVYIICVGTPIDKYGKVDDRPLKKALSYISGLLKKNDLIILRSTVAIGTCRNLVVKTIEKETKLKAGEDFFVAFAPERTIEGDALNELRSLPQVIGGYDKKSADLTVKLFNNLTSSVVLVDSLEGAEIVKLLNNTYRDLTFSFANEVALICDKFGLNSYDIIQAANYGYERSLIPKPSPGVGGYCLTKDPYILSESARSHGYRPKLPIISRAVNDGMIDYVADIVERFAKSNGKKKNMKIFVAGLAFKGEPETDDMRYSTSVEIIKKLKKRYKNIFVHDPVVSERNIRRAGFKYSSVRDGFRSADCVLILNNHNSYLDFNIYQLANTMKKPGLLFDAWHIFGKIVSKPIDRVYYRGV
ncbi:MAG: nucleotide sugar dehydrogenase [Patescibacteria group bacterium]|nr:nucleotide sugar dehydrogenase [Patescibacteria group bacterium]